MSDTVISWDDLTKGDGSVVVVDEVSFEVGRAEILGCWPQRRRHDHLVECRQELRRADQFSCGCWALTPLAEQDGWLQLPAGTVTFAVSAVHADRAQLVFMPTGSGAAWSARVVDQDRMAADGLRLAWNLSALSRAAHRRSARPRWDHPPGDRLCPPRGAPGQAPGRPPKLWPQGGRARARPGVLASACRTPLRGDFGPAHTRDGSSQGGGTTCGILPGLKEEACGVREPPCSRW